MIQFRLQLSTAHLSRFLLPALILLNVGCSDDARKNEFEVKQPSADEARAALIALVRDDHDPDLLRLCGGENMPKQMSPLKIDGMDNAEIGPFQCDFKKMHFSLYSKSDRHDFTCKGRFIYEAGNWRAVIDERAHLYHK